MGEPKKSFSLNPTVPTVFGREPEQLKNLPVVESSVKRPEDSSYYRNKSDPKRQYLSNNKDPTSIKPPTAVIPTTSATHYDQVPVIRHAERHRSMAVDDHSYPPSTSGPYFPESHQQSTQPRFHPISSSEEIEYTRKRAAAAPVDPQLAEKRGRKESPMQPTSFQYPNHNAIYRPSADKMHTDFQRHQTHLPVQEHPRMVMQQHHHHPAYGHHPQQVGIADYRMAPPPPQPSPVVAEQPHKSDKPEAAYNGPHHDTKQGYSYNSHPSHWYNRPPHSTEPSSQSIYREPPSTEPTYPDPTKYGGYRINQLLGASTPTSTELPTVVHKPLVDPPISSPLKGADQQVIIKLRNNLEAKEIEKQQQQQQHKLRHQSSSETSPEDEGASMLAARIRTKGELKGFTAIPVQSLPAIPPNDEPSPHLEEPLKTEDMHDRLKAEFEHFSNDMETTASGFDLMNWGDACDEFQQQLETGGPSAATTGGSSSVMAIKKRPRGRPSMQKRILDSDMLFETVEPELPLENLPGTDYKCDIDQSVVEIVKAENKVIAKIEEEAGASSSSDEDTPLVVLRQQSLNEAKIRLEVEGFSSSVKDSTDSGRADRDSILDRLCEKSAKCKQREKRELEKKITIKSSSDSEAAADLDRSKRTKKIIRKPRTRIGVKSNSSGLDSSDNDEQGSVQDSNKRKKMSGSSSSDDSEPIGLKKKLAKLQSDAASSSDEAPDIKTTPATKSKDKDFSSSEEEKNTTINQEEEKTPPNKKLTKTNHIELTIAETMTRSKRKREEEKEIANSKVLRNDKIIKNIPKIDVTKKTSTVMNSVIVAKPNLNISKTAKTTKTADEVTDELKSPLAKKRASNRLGIKHQPESESSEEESEPQAEAASVARLRTRSSKSINETTPDKGKSHPSSDKTEKYTRKEKTKGALKCIAGKESPAPKAAEPDWALQQQQLYEYKRSLKIPDSLINICRTWQRKSTSLPDLDPQHSSDASEHFSEHKRKLNDTPASSSSTNEQTPKKETKRGRPSNAAKAMKNSLPPAPPPPPTHSACSEPPSEVDEPPKSKSIIDLLHQRVIRPCGKTSKKFRPTNNCNEPRLIPQTKETELLSTPGVEAETVFKKHHNVFEPAILKSRTRKEHNVQKKQDIIRGVFGCDSDRPASAPPLTVETNPNGVTIKTEAESFSHTYDETFQQIMQKMNCNIGERIRKANKSIVDEKPEVPKMEEDEDAETKHPPVVLLQTIKQEKIDHDTDSVMNATEDDETQDMIILNECDIKEEEMMLDDRVDTPSVMSEREGQTPTSMLTMFRSKKNRGSRRKGSSGRICVILFVILISILIDIY